MDLNLLLRKLKCELRKNLLILLFPAHFRIILLDVVPLELLKH